MKDWETRALEKKYLHIKCTKAPDIGKKKISNTGAKLATCRKIVAMIALANKKNDCIGSKKLFNDPAFTTFPHPSSTYIRSHEYSFDIDVCQLFLKYHTVSPPLSVTI